MIRRPPRSTLDRSSAASDVYKRQGQGLHTEVSHIPINSEDRGYPCACGAYGCIEAYLAGTHFARHLSRRLGRELDGNQCLSVSYTHLRAHETVLDLVCRLLLEKKHKTKQQNNINMQQQTIQ